MSMVQSFKSVGKVHFSYFKSLKVEAIDWKTFQGECIKLKSMVGDSSHVYARTNRLAIDRDSLLNEENYEGMLVPFGLGEASSNFQNALAICNHYAITNEEPHDKGPLASSKGT